MKLKLPFAVMVVVFITSPLTAQEIPFQTQYAITNFDVPVHLNTVLSGINDSGQIAGYSYYSSSSTYQGFMLEDDAMTSITLPSFLPTLANGINNLSQIAGNYTDSTSHGYLKDGDTLTAFDVPDAVSTGAYGINDLEQIVGTYTDSLGNHGFLKDGDDFMTFDVPGAHYTFASKINNSGQIVGSYTYPSAPYNYHGFLKDGDNFTTLDVPGADSTAAYGINDLGQIVGYYKDSSGAHGFLKDGDNFTTFDIPGAFITYIYDINNLGQIVGCYYYSIAENRHGFIATPLSPELQLEAIIDVIEDTLDTGAMPLTPDQADGLVDKLFKVIESLENENPRAAINQLSAFINQVEGFVKAKKLTPEEGAALIASAEAVRDKI